MNLKSLIRLTSPNLKHPSFWSKHLILGFQRDSWLIAPPIIAIAHMIVEVEWNIAEKMPCRLFFEAKRIAPRCTRDLRWSVTRSGCITLVSAHVKHLDIYICIGHSREYSQQPDESVELDPTHPSDLLNAELIQVVFTPSGWEHWPFMIKCHSHEYSLYSMNKFMEVVSISSKTGACPWYITACSGWN